MNQERLNEIYRNPVIINNSDVDDLRQLAKDYPYFSKPFEILARYYFQTNHYRFEDMLRQAAIRVRDRKLLYEFIHSEAIQAKEVISEQTTETVAPQISTIENIIEAEDKKLGLDAFLDGIEINETLQSSGLESKDLELIGNEKEEEVEEIPFEFEGTFKLHDTVSVPLEQDIIGEEISTEFSFTKSFVQNEETDKSLISNIDIEEDTVVIDTKTEEEHQIELINEEVEEEIAESDTIKDEAIEVISENKESDNEEFEVLSKSSELDLRKYPVYSIETFVSQSETEPKTELDSSKDFFSWLKNPKHAVAEAPQIEKEIEEELAEESNEKVAKSLDIIEKFISINPQISRPKKEFFSPENMAKRSEVLDLEFVSETLAEIYYQQGNFDFAIKAYEKLSLQNPSKQSFFADLIDKIKKERK